MHKPNGTVTALGVRAALHLDVHSLISQGFAVEEVAKTLQSGGPAAMSRAIS